MTGFSIAGRPIGPGHPPYVIAELSGNHNGSLDRALALLDAAAATGADAVKLQTYTPDTITLDHDGPGFVIEGGLWRGRRLHELYAEAHTPWDWHAALFARAAELGVTLFSSPFDDTAIDLLETLGAPAYKIASFEAVDLPLIARAAATGKPLIISTGLCSLAEMAEALEAAQAAPGVALLHCVSAYPAVFADANLATIPDMAARFGCVIGLSDHTPGSAAAAAGVALGAAIIEKHITLARADGGPDAAFSLEPDEFARLVTDCRQAWEAVGRVSYDVEGSEAGNLQFRRSLYAVADIAAGELLTSANVRSIRPGFGLAPKRLPEVLGRRSAKAIARGTPLSDDLIA
jgi:pseudaminic acid synthase